MYEYDFEYTARPRDSDDELIEAAGYALKSITEFLKYLQDMNFPGVNNRAPRFAIKSISEYESIMQWVKGISDDSEFIEWVKQQLNLREKYEMLQRQ